MPHRPAQAHAARAVMVSWPPCVAQRTMPTLAAGTRLGPYDILAFAGRGGMGEVYRARDTRLGRQIALKVIGAAREAHPDLERRFDEEIRLAASLDHPRICAVYDVGQHDGIRYFVMEFLEGETLAARLARGPLPLGEVLDYGIEIASALAYAHRHHVLHRDVKPGNIFLTPAGIKVVDFGLAKLRRQLDSTPEISALDTLPVPITHPGFVHGTPEYLSPERLEGHEEDHRSDIFAFGAVLYEMATGHRAFDAPSPAALISSILTIDPPGMVGHGSATPQLEWVVRRCLRKHPDARWESMSDVEAVLKWLASSAARSPLSAQMDPASDPDRLVSGNPRSDATRVRTRASRMPLVSVVVGTALLCVAAVALARSWLFPPNGSAAAVVRFTLPVEPVPTINFGVNLGSRIAISRDAQRLAYVSSHGNSTKVYVRQFAMTSARAVEGTEGATGVFFSPSGDEVGFFANGKMRRVNVRGGAPSYICDVAASAGATWGDDGTIIFAPTPESVLARVPASGGTPQPVTALRDAETSHRWPYFLPGARAIVYTAGNGNDFSAPKIVLESLTTHQRTVLADGSYPRYDNSGHIVFIRDITLLALPFDAVRLEARGTPTPIATDIRMNSATGAALFDVAGSTLVYRSVSTLVSERVLVWVGMDGAEEVVPIDPRPLLQPRLSPDGTRVAFSVGELAPDRDVWTYDFVHQTFKHLTSESGEDETAVWSPDGQRIAFSAGRTGQPRMILTMPAESGAKATLLCSAAHIAHVSDWSPDGRVIAWTEFHPNGTAEIRAVDALGSGVVRTIVSGPFDARGAVFSPNGKWIAFASNESGRDEVYVQPYPGPGGPWRVSTSGGQEPAWSADGKSVFYRGDDQMKSVHVQTEPTFNKLESRVLFRDVYASEHRTDRNYDISSDGARFLMLKNARPFPPAELAVVLNWHTMLPPDR